MSAQILAIDTTAEFGSLALLRDGELVEEALLHSPEGFGHILFERMDQLLARHKLNAADIDCFAAASGPGSFTGVRVGLAAMKGLAVALGKPAVAVSNLAALASFGKKPLRAVLLDARRGQVYGAVYDSGLNLVSPEVVTRFPDWLAALPEGDLEFIATDFGPFRAAIAGTKWRNAEVTQAPRALASAVGRIARRRLASGEASDPAAIDANYVRRSDAELFWKDER